MNLNLSPIFESGRDSPATTSSDYEAMHPYWKMVKAVGGGLETIKAGGRDYLPQFEMEEDKTYNRRLDTVRRTNVFSDIVITLAFKPFIKPVRLGEDTAQDFVDLAEDVTGYGEDLHMFANKLFRAAARLALAVAVLGAATAQAQTTLVSNLGQTEDKSSLVGQVVGQISEAQRFLRG